MLHVLEFAEPPASDLDTPIRVLAERAAPGRESQAGEGAQPGTKPPQLCTHQSLPLGRPLLAKDAIPSGWQRADHFGRRAVHPILWDRRAPWGCDRRWLSGWKARRCPRAYTQDRTKRSQQVGQAPTRCRRLSGGGVIFDIRTGRPPRGNVFLQP